MSTESINPFDILSGKVVQNHHGTFWFKEHGNNVDEGGYPIYDKLHRLNGPAAEWIVGDYTWYIDGDIFFNEIDFNIAVKQNNYGS